MSKKSYKKFEGIIMLNKKAYRLYVGRSGQRLLIPVIS